MANQEHPPFRPGHRHGRHSRAAAPTGSCPPGTVETPSPTRDIPREAGRSKSRVPRLPAPRSKWSRRRAGLRPEKNRLRCRPQGPPGAAGSRASIAAPRRARRGSARARLPRGCPASFGSADRRHGRSPARALSSLWKVARLPDTRPWPGLMLASLRRRSRRTLEGDIASSRLARWPRPRRDSTGA